MNTPLFVGWGEADITPQSEAVELVGQYYQRLATQQHSPLSAVAMALSKDRVNVVMVTLDTVGVPGDYCERLRTAVRRQLSELSEAQLIFNATHTHSAAGLKPFRNWWEHDRTAVGVEAYRDYVEQRVVEAVTAAWSNRQPCSVAGILESARTGHSRRAVYADASAQMYGCTEREDFAGLESGEDSGVELLCFFDSNREPFGVVVNAACPSQVMEATHVVSSDFAGALREKLKQEYGPNFGMLYQISAAGCQSPRDLTRASQEGDRFWGPDGVEILSDRLLEAVRRGFSHAKDVSDADSLLSCKTIALSLPKRRVTYQDYINARKEVDRLEEQQSSSSAYEEFCRDIRRNEATSGFVPPYDDKTHHFVRIRNNEAVIRRYEEQDSEPNIEIMVQLVRIGEVVLAGNPFELFLEYGQRIKARSAANQTFLVQLADGSSGYLPTPRAEQLGGYGGLIINGQVGSDGGGLLVDRTVEAIAELWRH